MTTKMTDRIAALEAGLADLRREFETERQDSGFDFAYFEQVLDALHGPRWRLDYAEHCLSDLQAQRSESGEDSGGQIAFAASQVALAWADYRDREARRLKREHRAAGIPEPDCPIAATP